MSTADLLQQSLNALSTFFVGSAPLDRTLKRVVELAQQAVAPAEMTGITLLVDGRPSTAFFTHDDMVEIDTGQYAADTGPCVDAFRDGKATRIENVAEEKRWPLFVEHAKRFDVNSTLSVPLLTSDSALGALNFYSRGIAAFDSPAEAAATVFAQQATIVLANSAAYWGLHDLHEGLQEAVEHRAIIEQAKGILMARSSVDADRAFEMLIEASQRANRKLRDVARELVDSVTVLSETVID